MEAMQNCDNCVGHIVHTSSYMYVFVCMSIYQIVDSEIICAGWFSIFHITAADLGGSCGSQDHPRPWMGVLDTPQVRGKYYGKGQHI